MDKLPAAHNFDKKSTSTVLATWKNYTKDISHWNNGISWWRHEMLTLFVILALCEIKQAVNGGFSSQIASDAEF